MGITPSGTQLFIILFVTLENLSILLVLAYVFFSSYI